jgi:hypothetical protein
LGLDKTEFDYGEKNIYTSPLKYLNIVTELTTPVVVEPKEDDPDSKHEIVAETELSTFHYIKFKKIPLNNTVLPETAYKIYY